MIPVIFNLGRSVLLIDPPKFCQTPVKSVAVPFLFVHLQPWRHSRCHFFIENDEGAAALNAVYL